MFFPYSRPDYTAARRAGEGTIPVIASVSEAIQNKRLDCFVALAPRNDVTQLRLPAAQYVRVLPSVPLEKRAQGMPDALAHPQPCVRNNKTHKLVTTGSPVAPAFPAQWF
jgi:hypothetical protein